MHLGLGPDPKEEWRPWEWGWGLSRDVVQAVPPRQQVAQANAGPRVIAYNGHSLEVSLCTWPFSLTRLSGAKSTSDGSCGLGVSRPLGVKGEIL